MSHNKAPNIGLVKHQDIIQPFMLHNSNVRGRMVRLDEILNEVLSRHQYPQCVSAQLSEMMLLAAMLATNLPDGGLLTLQIKGDGAVSFMVCDVTQACEIRAYANITNAEAIAELPDNASMREIFGNGYFAITLSVPNGDPYQGIVPLDGDSISQATAHYFSQSQQLDVVFHNHVARIIDENKQSRHVAAGIMLERMPEIAAHLQQQNISPNDNWDYQKLLISTATPQELSDAYLAPSALLYRLFHEGGVWIYDAQAVVKSCRCSREKIETILQSLSEAELAEMKIDGLISVICQFCNREEIF